MRIAPKGLVVLISLLIGVSLAACEGNDTQVQKEAPLPPGAKVELPSPQLGMAQGAVIMVGQYPKLFIDGKETVPVMTFVNADFPNSRDTNISQVKLAAEEGDIHLHQVNAYLPPANSSGERNYNGIRSSMALPLSGDKEAKVVLRLVLGEYTQFQLYEEGDRVKFPDGSLGDMISLASDQWLEYAEQTLKDIIAFIRSEPEYAASVVGYIPAAGETGEWFQHRFREKGIDISDANTDKFRAWLHEKYEGNAELLAEAWAEPGITFESARIPGDVLFRGWLIHKPQTLYDKAEDQRVRDYLDYYNDMTASRINHLAKVAKEATEGQSLVGMFYGYLFDLPDAMSGHFSLKKTLESPDIDFFSAPVSYANRNEGQIGAAMSLTDSIRANGKLWINEDDFRSPIATNASEAGDGQPFIKSVEALTEVYRRELGFLMQAGTGGWPMDLFGRGWYDDAGFWQEIGALRELYERYASIRPAPSPDVVLIVDEEGLVLGADAWHVNRYLLGELRDELYRSGVSFGTYLRSDLEQGLVPEAKLYLMAGSYRLQADSVGRLKEQLHGAGKTVVWMHGFGMTDPEIVKELTGMQIVNTGEKTLAGIAVTDQFRKEMPNYTGDKAGTGGVLELWSLASDKGVEVLGTTDGYTTLARKKMKNSQQLFYGSFVMQAQLIRALAQQAGVHVFSDSFDVIKANGNMIVMHTTGEGQRTIRFTSKADVYEQFTGQWYTGIEELQFNAAQSKTYLFFYGNKSELQASGIGAH